MKTLLTTVFFAVTATVSSANPMCDVLKTYAEVTMSHRQIGTDISEVLKVVRKDAEEPALEQILTTIAIEAYKQPKFNTSSYQEEAIQEFSLEVYLTCLEAQ